MAFGSPTEAAVEAATFDPATPQQDDRRAGRSPGQIAWDRLRHDKVAIACAAVVLFFVLVAIFAQVLTNLEGENLNTYHSELLGEDTFPTIGTTANHWFGVEPRTGRDLFAMWAFGARPSLTVGFVAAIFSTLIGVALGLIAGYLGGWIDRVISWCVDFMLSIPLLLIVLGVVPIVQQRFTPVGGYLTAEETSSLRFKILIVILILTGWAGLTRLVRGEVYSLREREFVQAARVLGVPTHQILFKEILPNLLGPIIVNASIAVPAYITLEATLSYLGAGLIEPTASWGRTVANAQNSFARYPLYLWIPVISIAALVLALALIGDAIRDAFDPNTRR